jgi:hypothetical protein
MTGETDQATAGHTSHPWARVFQSQILAPLGITQASDPATDAIPASFSNGYTAQQDGLMWDVTASDAAVAGGAGAMISTFGGDLRTEPSSHRHPADARPQKPSLRTHVIATDLA